MSPWQYLVLPLICLAAFSIGCASVESTMVTRDETNHQWERHNCLNGIPITLKVPTHLKLYVFHNHYLQPMKVAVAKKDDGASEAEEPKVEIIDYQPVDVGVVVRDFAQELMYTDKVFVVDFKRPAAGSANLKVKMTDQQYIDKIQHDITDNTINNVGGLIAAANNDKDFATVSTTPEQGKPNYLTVRALVAVGIFEIDAPDFETKVQEFMECHVNKSHDAWVVPPGVQCVNRVGLGSTANGQVTYPATPLCPPCQNANPLGASYNPLETYPTHPVNKQPEILPKTGVRMPGQ